MIELRSAQFVSSGSDSCSSTPARVSSVSSARNISEADSPGPSVKGKKVFKWIFIKVVDPDAVGSEIICKIRIRINLDPDPTSLSWS